MSWGSRARREKFVSVVRSQLEGTAPATIWPPLADVCDQCGLWRGRNHVNDEGSLQRNAYLSARHYAVGAALIVVRWLRAGYVETILAGFESANREVARWICLNRSDLASALPLLQIPW